MPSIWENFRVAAAVGLAAIPITAFFQQTPRLPQQLYLDDIQTGALLAMSATGLPMLLTAGGASPSSFFAITDVGVWLVALAALRKGKGGKGMLTRMLTLELISCLGLSIASIIKGYGEMEQLAPALSSSMGVTLTRLGISYFLYSSSR